MKQMNRIKFGILTAVMLALAAIVGPAAVHAGIYSSNSDTTYKEYWIDHSQFTGGCNEDGSPTNPNGSFYIEPWRLNKCPKTLHFEIPDDVSGATRVEIYLDLWRNYDIKAARFKLNDASTEYAPNVGKDWSRTPWVGEVNTAELRQGANTITFYGEQKFHVHDVAIRVYGPLGAGPGSDVTPPGGQLLSIEDDNGEKAANAGGTLTVNDDRLTLKADVSGAQFVEFHAWYEGYDEDNDGNFRDWHNIGRNNWHPGGRPGNEPPPEDQGGTIDHVGTVAIENGQATIEWDVSHITNQAQMRFKIRVVDENGNVRDAAGGQSATFKMMRNRPVLAFLIPNFDDFGLHMGGARPDSVEYRFGLPSNINTFNETHMLGHYWNRPRYSLNDSPPNFASASSDSWMLQVRPFNAALLKAGQNKIVFTYSGSGQGQFIEHPGPMFVAARTSAASDNQPPFVSGQNPAPNATGVDEKASVVVHVNDIDFGVDFTTVRLRINGNDVTNNTKIGGVSSDYTLTYIPAQPFAFETVVNVGVEACDLVGNCMNAVNYSFTIEERDETPPVISNVVVDPRPEGARITWTTNEPATSRVDYGKTNGYELGNVSDPTLVTQHEIELTGLTPETLYHFRVRSTDELGNETDTPDDTFTTPVYPPVASDDFNQCQLDDLLWEFQNPVGDASLFMNGEQIELSVPAAVAHDFSGGDKSARMMQLVANENFSLEAKFDSVPTQPIQMQGVLVKGSDTTFIRYSFEFTKMGELKVFAIYTQNGSIFKSQNKVISTTPVTSLYLRVQRTGNNWSWQYSTNGVNYATGGNLAFTLPVVEVGLFAGNAHNAGGDAPAHTAVVDYFFNTASPINPEDGMPITVDETVVGNGTVVVDPDKAKYLCGEPVSLTAVPQPGWSFDSWSGSVISTTNPLNFTIDGPENVTATFTQDQYTLTVDIEPDTAESAGNTVNRSPSQPTYVYQDQVTLTAVPAPGWQFVNWSGAVTGTNPVVTLTMLQSENVTATFAPIPYSLEINIINMGEGEGGTVTVSPQKDSYIYGDQVTLTADPNPGWIFAGWSGAVTGSNLTRSLTITGNAEVTAEFVQGPFTLNVNTGGNGTGTVTVAPDQAEYYYGDVVTLTAAPGAGFFFGGWQGDLLGAENPVQYTMTKNSQITAIFTDNPPPVVEPISDRTTLVGQMVSIQVRASDADGSTPTLSADNLPLGATFVDNGDGTGNFSWTPGVGDRGDHVITFIAQDSSGIGVGSQTVTITVEGYALALPAVLR